METHDRILVFAASESQNKDSSAAPNLGPTEFKDVSSVVQSSYITSPSDQGIPPSSTTPAKPAQEESLLGSLSFPKLKSGFEELVHPIDDASVKDYNTRLKNSQPPCRCSPEVGLARNGTSAGAAKDDFTLTMPDTPQQPLSEATAEEGDEHVRRWGTFINMVMWAEWVAFTCVAGLLIASLTVLRKTDVWEVELWKWCVLVLAIFSGRLVSELLMTTLGFLIEGRLWLKEKVLYLLYGLKHSVQVFIWLVFVLSVWALLIYHGGKRSRHAREIQSYVTRAFASCLSGAAIWFIKTLLIKLLAASFHYKAFFEPIHAFIYHQQVIMELLGNQSMEREGEFKGQLSFLKCVNGAAEKLEKVIIHAELLTQMKKEHRISAWNMRRLISSIIGSGISILDGSLDHPDQEIHICSEAAATATKIFEHVDLKKKGCIEGEDLMLFMKEEDVAKFIPLIQGPEGNGKINKPILENWLVTVHREKKLLTRTLKDADTVVNNLNRLVSAIMLVVIIIMSLLIMGLLTTETLIFISSQLLLVVFMFGNTARIVFEAVIFIFVTHPFDVEDRCVIDGVQLVVKKMDILTTTFARYDGEKIYYPNSVLATKPISNFNRSDNMGDSVEFTVDFSTSVDRIADLKKQVKTYLESKPNHWKKEHSVVVKEIEDVNKVKMGLYVTHTINFQNPGDRSSRRSELVLELKRIFEAVGIKYRLLPQEVQVCHAGSAAV